MESSINQRRYPRRPVKYSLSILYQGKKIPVTLLNVSMGGVFLRIEKNTDSCLNKDSVGEEIKFEVEDSQLEEMHNQGEIVRFCSNEKAYLGVRFT